MRAYATCGNLGQTNGISNEIQLALARLHPTHFSDPKPYWKMPEFFEFSFNLSPATEHSFLEIIKSCDGGWLHMRDDHDRSSVWNRVEGLSLLTPSIAWAELALIP
jgi:hypothetical protein